MSHSIDTHDQFLRNALRANGVFSIISGVAFLVAGRPLASWMGLGEALILQGVGVSLLVFAGGLFFNAARSSVNRTEAWTAVALDVAWVLGSFVLIAFQVLTTAGNWAVAVVADLVLVFAILQGIGLRLSAHEKASVRKHAR